MAEAATKETEFKLEEHPEFKKLKESNATIARVAQSLLNENKQLKTSLEGIQSTLEKLETSGARGNRGGNDDDPGDQDVDPNEMDNRQLVKFVVERVADVVSKNTGKLKEEVDTSVTNVTREQKRKEIEDFAAKNPDFWEFTDEIKELAQENPQLSINRLYSLAKSENPEKAKEVAEKFEKENNKGKESEEDKRPKFGGLTPTSGGHSKGSRKEGEKNLSLEEASEKAWDETVGSLDASLAGEDQDLHGLSGT